VLRTLSHVFLVSPNLAWHVCVSWEGCPADTSDWANIKGLPEALADTEKSKVASIYSYDTADKTWDLIHGFKGEGEAIFTQPFGVIKCAGGEWCDVMCLPSCSAMRKEHISAPQRGLAQLVLHPRLRL
jgi:hypothetical protein